MGAGGDGGRSLRRVSSGVEASSEAGAVEVAFRSQVCWRDPPKASGRKEELLELTRIRRRSRQSRGSTELREAPAERRRPDLKAATPRLRPLGRHASRKVLVLFRHVPPGARNHLCAQRRQGEDDLQRPRPALPAFALDSLCSRLPRPPPTTPATPRCSSSAGASATPTLR